MNASRIQRTMPRTLCEDLFQFDGRGPELRAVHWTNSGHCLRAVDYFNPDDAYTPECLKHVLFQGVQVVLITPEEVIGSQQLTELLTASQGAGIFELGRSDWLLGFGQRHLKKCSHFQVLFYDELFDVICESVECRTGGYSESTG